jgi:TRIAP1/MDM35 family protein
MESIDPECTTLKQKYEACFYTWYSEKFLKGDTRDECAELFKEYRACLDVRTLF